MRAERDEVRTQVQANRVFNNKIKTKMNKNHPEGEKQTGRELCTVHIHTRHKTTDQHRTADTRRLNRETNEGNEGDTGGATETMIN